MKLESEPYRKAVLTVFYWISRNSARGTNYPNSKSQDLGFRIVMESQPAQDVTYMEYH